VSFSVAVVSIFVAFIIIIIIILFAQVKNQHTVKTVKVKQL